MKEKYHEIVIIDNGIKNVKERLHKMCHGTVSVESKPGEGTTVTLRIPI